MPFAPFGLHADLLRGVRELGFTRPTPIQQEAIPPALEGRDILACAMTGSGKTAAFVLPILHRLAGKPRRTTRALVLTPTRELAAQIEEHLNALAVHTPLSGAAVFGGVGMGPQERARPEGTTASFSAVTHGLSSGLLTPLALSQSTTRTSPDGIEEASDRTFTAVGEVGLRRPVPRGGR